MKLDRKDHYGNCRNLLADFIAGKCGMNDLHSCLVSWQANPDREKDPANRAKMVKLIQVALPYVEQHAINETEAEQLRAELKVVLSEHEAQFAVG